MFLKFIVCILLVLNLMLHYSTCIYPVVFTYKTCQNIFFFLPRKLTFLHSGLFWEMHVLLFHRYQGIFILWNWRTYSKHIKWNIIYHVLWYHIKYWHTLKEGQVTLDCSPEVLFNTSNLYVSIKTDHALDEPLAGPFLSPELLLGQI